MYQNEHTRADLEAKLPLAAKYFSEVHQHAKDTSATVHSSTTADPKQLASDFGSRARATESVPASRSDRGQLGADTELNDARRDQADDGGSKGTEASDTSPGGSKDAGSELGQRLLSKSVVEARAAFNLIEKRRATAHLFS